MSNSSNDSMNASRRAFLQRASALSVAGVAAPWALNLAAIAEASAATATDYKAIVCVFLYGGNDYGNTVVPYDQSSYDAYFALRPTLATPRTALAGTILAPTTAPVDAAGFTRQYALAPQLAPLMPIFNAGKMGVLLNVGTLVQPITKQQYVNKSAPLPPKLFSHNDQQSIWQSSSPEGSTIGWGGNIGDLALSSNSTSLFTCINVTGNAVFLSGDSALSYQISSGGGAVAINGVKNNVYGSSAVKTAMTTLVQQSRSHTLENEYNKVTARAIGAETQITSGLAGVTLATAFPTNNSLADQLKTVARLIGARNALGTRRQVFLVSIGGFDLHDNLIAQHPGVLGKVSDALTAFYKATVELGVANKVTAFTASDFGRTLASNGDGSDHGWGSHHLMVGGAVKGKAFYGTPPPVSVGSTAAANDQWHVGQGRLLPSTSVDQYAATLAKWFGVADSELTGILPNISRFGVAAGRPDYPVNLGFMG